MAGDGGYGRHREREKIGNDGLKVLDHVVKAISETGFGAGCLGPGEVEAVGEEFALRCGDKNRSVGGL